MSKNTLPALVCAGILGAGAAIGVAACGENRGSVEIEGGSGTTGTTGTTSTPAGTSTNGTTGTTSTP
jgi:hypothetical protein